MKAAVHPASLARSAFASIALGLNTIVMSFAMLPAALVKTAMPAGRVREAADRMLNAIARRWVANNGLWLRAVGATRWTATGLEGLDPRGWYVIVCNHQSWVDIFALQRTLAGHLPLLKFVLKRELLYVPVIGFAWWALDFPFVRRQGGARAGRDDLDSTRRACERFRAHPTALLTFVEGTRWREDKALAQRSPYRRLLKPKAGGLTVALQVLGDRLDGVLDVTIAYPGAAPTFGQLLAGEVPEVLVRVRKASFPAPGGAAPGDGAYRAAVQAWLAQRWQEKDAELAALAGR